MKKLISTMVYSLLTIVAYGQYNLSGKVTDKENKPIKFATVVLKKDNLVIEKSQTDELGKYKLSKIKAGNYTVLSSHIHFSKKETPVSLTKDTIVDIQLLQASKQLQEVTVTSQKRVIEQKADRTVFNVENSTTTIGADGLEALAKTPGVRVDNNGVSLIGKGAVNVMIDDRPSQLSGDDLKNLLKSMSADDISKIEVIHSPGAKYDAQGTSGLINIVTKRSTKLGYNGNARLGYTQTTYPEISTGGNLSYNKNKLRFHSNVNVTDGSSAFFEQFTYFYPRKTLEQKNNKRQYDRSLAGQINVGYQASKVTTLGLSYNGSTSKPNTKENITSPTYNLLQSTTDYITITNANNDAKNRANTIGVDLKHLLDTTGKKITFNGDWFTATNNYDRTLVNNNYFPNGQLMPNSFSQSLSGDKEQINTYTLKMDVELPFKNFSLSAGGKLLFTYIKNNISNFQLLNNNYQPDYTQTYLYDYKENTPSALHEHEQTR